MGQNVNGGYKLDYSGEEIDSRLSLLKNVSRQTALIGDTENNKARGANVTNAAAIGTGLEVSGYGLAFGKYNVHIPTPGHLPPGGQGYFIEEVGNGTDAEHRSNARTLDWQGNMWTAGRQTMGALPTGAMDAVPRCLVTNPNLLDNAYFVGGGAGYGVFPVNQRGQTQYSGSGYGIDRWFSSNSRLSIAMNPATGIMSLSASSAGNAFLIQKVAVSAGTHTFSVLVKGSGGAGQLRIDSGDGTALIGDAVDFSGLSDSWELISGTFTVDTAQIVRFVIRVNTGKTYDLEAAKLERGSIQTLAHQESGAWVLNEIPRYDDELRKCLAWLKIIKPTGTERCLLGSGYVDSGTDAKRALFPVPLSVPMHPITSVTSTGVGVIQTGVGDKYIDAIALFCQTSALVTLNVTLTTAVSSPPYAALTAYVRIGGSVIISAESN